ncbi:HEAT repeat domain-containing protein [Halomicroarcula sp. GCM10025817]|uniref:HEAT repeat domain-containing protein n=1 Tax=Haloarcula TaxID=2237 RepID=UPI0023E7EF0D|nr:HEAT repeat domain-containing protein [Halomicroarcula sp. SYNS111]
MSNGDDEPDAEDAAEAEAADVTADELETRLDEAAATLEAAETEADLDDVEATLEAAESDLEAADLPEPDEDEDDAEAPREALESRLSDLQDDLESQRGPYAADVVDSLETAQGTVTDSEWTESGESDAVDAVDAFLATSQEHVDHDADVGDDTEAAAAALGTVADAIADADLNADDDAETIAALLEAAETLEDDLEAAEVWDDLTVQEQLDAKGFYDILTNENRKDFPPEWNAAKLHAQEGNLELVLFALEKVGSEFMEENIVDIFYHLGSDAEPAFDVMHQRAQKRNKQEIGVLGKIGDERATETLHDFIDGDGDVALQKVTLRALGAIGSSDSVQPVANRLDAENPEIRSVAARTLGLLGDTRAIDPLADILASDDSDEVRASAAWALRQIGTQAALDEAAQYADDRAYLVQAEAEKAADA